MGKKRNREQIAKSREVLLNEIDCLGWSIPDLATKSCVHHSNLYRFFGNPKKGMEPTGGIGPGCAYRVYRALEEAGVGDQSLSDFVEGLGFGWLKDGRTNTLEKQAEKVRREEVESQEESRASQPTMEELLSEKDRLNHEGLWFKAEEQALAARQLCEPGTQKWAEITLDCAGLCQQAGDIVKADQYIRSVETSCLQMADQPNPGIQAQVNVQKLWIGLEQWGDYSKETLETLDLSILLAREAGDPTSEGSLRHIKVRALSESGMQRTNAWTGARPDPLFKLNTDDIKGLWKALADDWPAALGSDPDNPHRCNRKFMVLALIAPDKARQELKPSVFRDTGHEHGMQLNLARWYVSNEDWGAALYEARDAYREFRRIHYPQGIAIAATIWAHALRTDSALKTKNDFNLCTDLLVLALLLHVYCTHPLWQTARKELKETLEHHPEWVPSYFRELDLRIKAREGVFEALNDVYIEYPPATPYILMLLPRQLWVRTLALGS